MKKYIGTRQIEAEPMTMGEAYAFLLLQAGRVPRENEMSNDGYHVRYEDGHESWSPADVFEKAYKLADTFLDRLRIERDELSLRYNKAQDFYYSADFGKVLSEEERKAFTTQLDLMRNYISILDERIRLANDK